ncbi:MAG: sulfite exporter TauE/SafE family protein [Mangrovicoccus sp.]
MPTELLILSLAAFIVGMSKGGLTAAGALAVPLLSIWMDPLMAAGTLLPVYIASDLVGIYIYRRGASWPNVKILVFGAALGIAIAVVAAPYLPREVITLFTGLIGLSYCSHAAIQVWRKKTQSAEFRSAPGIIWGALVGLTSFISHNGAPPFHAFVMPQRLSNLAFAATATWTFTAVNLIKLPAYAGVGLGEALRHPKLPILISIAIIGAFCGRFLVGWLPPRIYMMIIQTLLFLVSNYLCVISVIALV